MSAPLPPPFRVESSYDGMHAFVAPHGELDIATVSQVGAAIDRAVDGGMRCVVLDLGRLTFMDSTGVALLLRCRDHASENGHRFALRDGSQVVMRALYLAGLADHFERYGT